MLLFFGVISGVVFSIIISGKSEGKKGLIHWQYFIDMTGFHIHHWMIMLIILIISHSYEYQLVNGFLIGGIIHGLTYDDCFDISP